MDALQKTWLNLYQCGSYNDDGYTPDRRPGQSSGGISHPDTGNGCRDAGRLEVSNKMRKATGRSTIMHSLIHMNLSMSWNSVYTNLDHCRLRSSCVNLCAWTPHRTQDVTNSCLNLITKASGLCTQVQQVWIYSWPDRRCTQQSHQNQGAERAAEW